MALELYQTSSLNKTLINSKAAPLPLKRLSCLKGEEVSYQIITKFSWNQSYKGRAKVTVTSSHNDTVTIREIGNVPVELPTWRSAFDKDSDDSYISFEPGIYPDPLYDIKDNTVELLPDFFRGFWISVKTNVNTEAGVHTITVKFDDEESETHEEAKFEIEVIDAALPEQELIFTQWFHADCLADFYGYEVFSDEHWNIIEKFIKVAADNGINMILTPIFTPPLDTEIGKERPTVQLVDISKNDNAYSFNFDKLKKWIEICSRYGIKYYEMAHLFSQWGAKCTPKIVVTENGEPTKKFGWHVAADDAEYINFLGQFLPALTQFFKAEGISENVYFHISDEPHMPDKEHYRAAKNIIKPLIGNCKTMDALSDYELYCDGLVDTPAVGLYKIKDFINAKAKGIWAYYCCSHNKNVSNRFIAQKSVCNRVIALQLYKYDIVGFLQWGYNFYYSQLSRELINPYAVTDSRNAFPSGDPFSVYPGKDGAIESMRLKVFKEALQDLRALKYLEKFMSKDDIVKMIEDEAGCEIEFDKFPKDEDFIIRLREKINSAIKDNI